MSGWGCCPLSFRGGSVCVGRVVVLLFIVHVCSIALVSVRGVAVACYLGCMLLFVVWGVVKLLFFFLCALNSSKKKKIFASPMAASMWYVTYGIRAGSTHDLGSLRLLLI
jgi:hypothetical protein